MAKKKNQRRIEYLPPAQEDIDAYARAVCQKIAQAGDPSYTTPEVVHGLAEFMKIAGKIQAKHLNRVNLVTTMQNKGIYMEECRRQSVTSTLPP